jgi:DNA-3-methyladenine glycosylase
VVGGEGTGGGVGPLRRPFDADLLSGSSLSAARHLLGAVLEVDSPQGTVAMALSEVEAYAGLADPASHAYRGRTPRNAVMFGPAGFLYVYFVYGMHWCCNVVTGPGGEPSAVLLRAGRVVAGEQLAHARRPAARTDAELGRGPARLATALGVTGPDTGTDLLDAGSRIRLLAGDPVPEADVRAGPRVGVAVAAEVPWRLWVAGDPSVSPYRPGTRRRRIPT